MVVIPECITLTLLLLDAAVCHSNTLGRFQHLSFSTTQRQEHILHELSKALLATRSDFGEFNQRSYFSSRDN